MTGIGAAVQLKLRVEDGAEDTQREVTLAGPIIQVGRGQGNDITFDDKRVSSMHGRLVLDGDRVRYQDLGSTNGSALIRDGKRTPLGHDDPAGADLAVGDAIQLGDADRPSSIVLIELVATSAPPPDATILAQRALGEVRGLPPAEAFRRLLALLAKLRTEDDSFSLARRVLQFCTEVMPGVSKAECFMRDTTGRYAPALAVGPEGQAAVGGPPSATLIARLDQERQALLVEDLQAVPDASASMQALPARSLLLSPLVVEDQMVGALQLSAGEGGRFVEQDLDLLSVLAQQLAAVLAGSQLIRKLKEQEDRLRDQCDYLKHRLDRVPALDEMVGRSPVMQQLREQIMAVAGSKTTVLIRGQTGAGKELVARALHENSPRAEATFAAVNCSALAAGVLESELFGHVRGAFTGAHRSRKGLFEVADGGTLFLDEVGDMPPALQPKLLRVIEEGLVTPVGSTQPRPVDVRLVAATHRDLEAAVTAGDFRQDLLFRLNVFQLEVPALTQRTADVLPLARHFLQVFAAEHARQPPEFTPEAAAALQAYDWPGNVRELKNEMERAVLLTPAGENIGLAHLSDRVRGGLEAPAVDMEGSLKDIIERLEAMVLKCALQRHQGNRTHCARALGISRQALIAKIQRLGVEEDG